MRRWGPAPVLLFPFIFIPVWASAPFHLSQIADRFPSEGFEHQIEFWKLVFAKYTTREVVIHDLDDLRLIYHTEVFERGIEGDPKEAKRQREILLKRIETVGEWIRSLKYKDEHDLEPHQKAVYRILSEAGYPMQPEMLDRLSRNLRYQRGVRDKFREGLVRSGMYLPWIEQVFSERGLPLELAYLPHVESSFDYNAYSKSGAAGIWQFTRGTGRLYLQVGSHIDERLDPIRATEAAARVLAENYRDLGNWPLAITAYNHGRNGMLRAKAEHGSDLRTIIRNYRAKLFGFASRNFYAEFLAALLIARNHHEYFGPLEPDQPLEFDTVDLVRATPTGRLTQVPGVTQEDLLHLNPHLRRFVAVGGKRIPAGIEVRVPKGRGEAVLAALRGSSPSAPVRAQAAPGTRHTVRPGESLGMIASRHGTTVSELRRLNRLSNPDLVHPGQELLVREESPRAAAPAPDGPPAGVSSPAAAAERQESGGAAGADRYTVQRGDSLSSIARRFGTTVEHLLRLNQLDDPNRIKVGTVLRIAGEAEAAGRTQRYRVQPGDTLARIAQRFGTSVEAISTANRLSNPHQIRRGQELVIPVAE